MLEENMNGAELRENPNFQKDVRKEILSLFSDERLKGKFSISDFNLQQIRIQLLIQKVTLIVKFLRNFPESAPIISLQNTTLPKTIEDFFIIDDWTPKSRFCDVITNIYETLEKIFQSEHSFGKNLKAVSKNLQEIKPKQPKQSSEENGKKKTMMNGCADNQLTETKNLNRHFRSKLRQVYNDMVKYGQVPSSEKDLENAFNNARVGFEDISELLKKEWFNNEVKKQMHNGKFMHKIMKGMMSIKSKKLMVKYYHVMLAAVEDPKSFVKWKYN